MRLDELDWQAVSAADLRDESHKLRQKLREAAEAARKAVTDARSRAVPDPMRFLQDALEAAATTNAMMEASVLLIVVSAVLSTPRDAALSVAEARSADDASPAWRWFRLQFEVKGRQNTLFVTRDLPLSSFDQLPQLRTSRGTSLLYVNLQWDVASYLADSGKRVNRWRNVRRVQGLDANAANVTATLEDALKTLGAPAKDGPRVRRRPATEPEAAEPEAREPEVSEPEAAEPEAGEPEVSEPEAAEPEAREPEAREPEVVEPEVVKPEVVKPEVAIRDPAGAEVGLPVPPSEAQPIPAEHPQGKPVSEWDGFVVTFEINARELELELEASFLATRADPSRLGQQLLQMRGEEFASEVASRLRVALDTLYDPDVLVDLARLCQHVLNHPSEAAELYRKAVVTAKDRPEHRAHWFWMRFVSSQPTPGADPIKISDAYARLRELTQLHELEVEPPPIEVFGSQMAKLLGTVAWVDVITLLHVLYGPDAGISALPGPSEPAANDLGLARYLESRKAPREDWLRLYKSAADKGFTSLTPALPATSNIAYARALRRVEQHDTARSVWRRMATALFQDEAVRKQLYVFYELTGNTAEAQKLRDEFRAFTSVA